MKTTRHSTFEAGNVNFYVDFGNFCAHFARVLLGLAGYTQPKGSIAKIPLQ